MACDCKDDNGSLMDRCMGTCKLSLVAIIQDYQEQYSNLHNTTMSLIRDFRHEIEYMRSEVRASFGKMYKDGFKDGFEMAKDTF